MANAAAKNALELEFLKQKNKANLSYQSALADMRSNAPMTAAEKANYQLQLEQLGLSKWEAQQRVAQEEKRRRLEAIGQLQSAISTTDPAAFAAMMAAYGGNIENALAGGGTALSPAAMLPAAALFAELGGTGGAGGMGGGTGGGSGTDGRPNIPGEMIVGEDGIPRWQPPEPGGGATTGGSAASTERVEKLLGKIQEIIARQMARPGKAGYNYERLTKSRIQSEIDRRSKYAPALKLAYEYYKGIDSENPTISLDTLMAYLDAMEAAAPYEREFRSWVNQRSAANSNANAQGWAQAYQQALAEGKTTAPNWLAYQDEYYKAVDDYNKQVESYYQPVNSTLTYEQQQALGDIPVYSINGRLVTEYGPFQGIWNPTQTASAPSGIYRGGQYQDTTQTWDFANPFAHPSVLPQNQGQPTPVSALPPGDWALNTVVGAPYTATGSEFTYDGGQYTPVSSGTTLNIGTPYWVQGMATGGKAPTDEPYMVGEIGPELIIPGKNGDEVIPLYDVPGYANGTGYQWPAAFQNFAQYLPTQWSPPPNWPMMQFKPYQFPTSSQFAPTHIPDVAKPPAPVPQQTYAQQAAAAVTPNSNIPGRGTLDLSRIRGFAFGTDDPRETAFSTTSTTPTTTTARDATVPYVPPTTTNTTTPTTTKTTDGYRPTTGTTGGTTTGGSSTPTNTTPTSYNQSPVPTDVATSWANMGIFGNNIQVPEWLQPFVSQVQDIREGVQYPSLNPYAVNFGLTDPTIMQMWALGRQAQYGIPVASTMFEAQRQALPGIGSTYSVRY